MSKFFFFFFNFLKFNNSLSIYLKIILLILIEIFIMNLTFKTVMLRFYVYVLIAKLIDCLLIFLN